MYRYGDGTPFPFQANFIETLVAAVEASAGAFGASAEIEERRDKAREARKEAEDELRRFGLMEKAIETAVMPHRPSSDRAAGLAQQAAFRALHSSRAAIAAVRATVEQRLQLLAGEPRTARAVERTHNAMAGFFEKHELPDTTWRHEWRAEGARASAEASCESGRFHVAYELDLEAPWTTVVRIGALVPGLEARVIRKKLFGGTRRTRLGLDRCGLVLVERTADRHALVIREHAARPSPGWRVVLRDPERSGATMVAVTADGRAVGNELALDGDDAAPLQRLGEAVDAALEQARASARRLRALQVGDTALEALPDPALAGRALLDVLGPLIKEIRARSRVPGELAIKRDIVDGRREELFVPRDVVERKFATLPPLYRRVYEALGLGREVTDADALDDSGAELQTVPGPRVIADAAAMVVDEIALTPTVTPVLPMPARPAAPPAAVAPTPAHAPPPPQPPASPRLPMRPLPLEPAAASELPRRRQPPEPPRPVARGTDAPPLAEVAKAAERTDVDVDVLEVMKPRDPLAKLPEVPPTLPRVTQMKSA